jgi:hypothetical protein
VRLIEEPAAERDHVGFAFAHDALCLLRLGDQNPTVRVVTAASVRTRSAMSAL